ncbi:MAG: ABC transporter permease [Actinomycetota bacterium]|nr:ABC transporter permease [Actinomycetota bacterium]
MAMPLPLRVFEAEAQVYRHTWRGSIVSSFLNPILYLAAMGVGLGSLVDQNLPGGVEGISYLAFLAPGLLVATAMQTGAGEGSWKVMAGIKWTRTYHAKLATPISVPSLVAGHILWSGARVLMVSVIFAVIMTAFRIAPLFQSLLAVGPALLVGLAMASVTTAITARLEDPTGLMLYFRFVVIPMFLFSGVFFPVTQLPVWLQPIALATPLFHGVELSRVIVVGIPSTVTWWVSVLYLVSWIAVGTVLAVGPFRKRLTP